MKIKASKDIDQYVAELLSNFAYQIDEVEHRISIEPLQKNTSELREKLEHFVDRHKDRAPQINQLTSFVRNLKDGEYFYIFPNVQLETIQIAELGNRLHALNQGLDLEIIQDDFSSIFGDLLSNYDMLAFNGESRVNIGVTDKSKAKCRFCGKSSPNVSFRKKAHAISEALGNKGIVCNEECDTCNAKFGAGIETDLIAFLSMHRAFFGIKGKGSGAPKLKGRNFSIKKAETGEVHFSVIGEDDGLPEQVEAHTNEKVALQNIYRAMCKYVLSVIPEESLASFKTCVSWINQENSNKRLPAIRMKIVKELYSEFPGLSIYIRKNSDTELPHVVGEFRFASIVIVFIVPCSDKDNHCFVNDHDFDKFWRISHFSKHKSHSKWVTMKLDSDEKKVLSFNVKFEQRV